MPIENRTPTDSSVEWENIHRRVVALGKAVADQFEAAVDSLRTHDSGAATHVMAIADHLNRQERELEACCCEQLSQAQEVDSSDVRRMAAVANIGTELDRICNEATCIAQAVNEAPPERLAATIDSFAMIREIAGRAGQLLNEALYAIEGFDTALASRLIAGDEVINHESQAILRNAIMVMLEDHSTISPALDALALTNSVERISSHIKGIAHWVLYAADNREPANAGKAAALHSV